MSHAAFVIDEVGADVLRHRILLAMRDLRARERRASSPSLVFGEAANDPGDDPVQPATPDNPDAPEMPVREPVVYPIHPAIPTQPIHEPVHEPTVEPREPEQTPVEGP